MITNEAIDWSLTVNMRKVDVKTFNAVKAFYFEKGALWKKGHFVSEADAHPLFVLLNPPTAVLYIV